MFSEKKGGVGSVATCLDPSMSFTADEVWKEPFDDTPLPPLRTCDE